MIIFIIFFNLNTIVLNSLETLETVDKLTSRENYKNEDDFPYKKFT